MQKSVACPFFSPKSLAVKSLRESPTDHGSPGADGGYEEGRGQGGRTLPVQVGCDLSNSSISDQKSEVASRTLPEQNSRMRLSIEMGRGRRALIAKNKIARRDVRYTMIKNGDLRLLRWASLTTVVQMDEEPLHSNEQLVPKTNLEELKACSREQAFLRRAAPVPSRAWKAYEEVLLQSLNTIISQARLDPV
eukprot:1123891-Amorphochlora_amoeboformis.AAC.1